MTSVVAQEASAENEDYEYFELKRLIFFTLWSLVFEIVLTVAVQIFSGSLALGAVLIDSAASMLLHIFNMISVGIILRRNAFSHPYGTGKLENFAGFLYAVATVPGGLWIIFSAYNNYLNPPQNVYLGPATVCTLVFIIRAYWLYGIAKRIVQRYPQSSPMTITYFVGMRVTTISSVMLFAGMLIGYSMSFTKHAAAVIYFDIAIASVIGLYMLYTGISILISNFKSLVDMPLPEPDQFKILQALTAHFEDYEGIGNVYSQLSGSTRLVQIELYVKAELTARDINDLSAAIEKRLKEQFGKLVFHLIPLVRENA